MLTQEEIERIEAEEKKRHAEEQLREEVRARLRRESKPAPTPAIAANTKPNFRIPWLMAGIVLLVIGVLFIGSRLGNSDRATAKSSDQTPASSWTPPVPKTRYVPFSQKIATGQIIVRALGYVQYRITVEPGALEPVLTGNFTASGGMGNDITAVLADEMNATNWINGHQARAFWSTPAKETTGTFEVRLRPGTYYLVFSNKFSTVTDKQVFLEVDLNSKRAETYY